MSMVSISSCGVSVTLGVMVFTVMFLRASFWLRVFVSEISPVLDVAYVVACGQPVTFYFDAMIMMLLLLRRRMLGSTVWMRLNVLVRFVLTIFY